MNANRINAIAHETMRALQNGRANRNKLMSFGAKNFVATMFENKAGVRFNVNGFKHKGRVYAVLNEGADMYEVYITTQRDRIIEHVAEVWFDTLTDTIDFLVETENDKSDEYRAKVNNFFNEVLFD